MIVVGDTVEFLAFVIIMDVVALTDSLASVITLELEECIIEKIVGEEGLFVVILTTSDDVPRVT
jgi:hypothetical protein